MRARVVAALLGAGALAVPGPGGGASGQAALDVVDSLAAAGRTGEARERLVGWWEDASGGAARHEIQRALWLRGRLSTGGEDAERAYQRLVVEFPGGPYSARAHLRLGQLAHARGDLPGAAERFRTVVRDYAETPQRLEALRWLERHGGRAAEMAALGGPPRGGAVDEPARRDPEPEPAAREVGREPPPLPTASASTTTATVPADSPPATAADPPVEPATPSSGRFAVQVGAFSREGGARTLAARVEGEGLEARLVRVPGSDLIRVRVGRFGNAREARTVEARLRRLGFETAVVSDARTEVPIR